MDETQTLLVPSIVVVEKDALNHPISFIDFEQLRKKKKDTTNDNNTK